jgi:hypothetical protein
VLERVAAAAALPLLGLWRNEGAGHRFGGCLSSQTCLLRRHRVFALYREKKTALSLGVICFMFISWQALVVRVCRD